MREREVLSGVSYRLQVQIVTRYGEKKLFVRSLSPFDTRRLKSALVFGFRQFCTKLEGGNFQTKIILENEANFRCIVGQFVHVISI